MEGTNTEGAVSDAEFDQSVSTASDKEVKELLDYAMKVEAGEIDEEEEKPSAEKAAKEEAEPKGDKEEDAEPADEAGEAESEPDKKPEGESSEDLKSENKVLRAKVENLERYKKESDTFIATRNQELGETRKALREVKAQLEEGLEAKLTESPKEGLDDRDKIAQIDNELRGIDQEQQALEQIRVNQQIVFKHLKPDEIDIDAMAETLKSDGFGEDVINNLRQNPFGFVRGDVFVHLARRARTQGFLNKLLPYTKALVKRVSELEKKAKEGPRTALRAVQRNLRAPTPITSASGSARPSKKGLDGVDPTKLSDDELKSALREARGF